MTALALRTFSTHLLNTALLVLLVTADRLEAPGAEATAVEPTLAILLTANAYRLPPPYRTCQMRSGVYMANAACVCVMGVSVMSVSV